MQAHMKKSSPHISPLMRQLSTYIAGALKKPLPKDVEEKARHLVLDTLAAMVSGSRLHPGQFAISYVKSLGRSNKEACIAGTKLMTCAVDAALANGMLAHADETDDSHGIARMHPACSIVPAALAMAEREGRSGKHMLRAVVLGYDIGCRLTFALGATPAWHAGISTHGFGGTFGSAVAAGALAGLDARQMRYLLSYAAQQASGSSCLVRDSEHIEKAFDLGGMPARNGVTAATMVAHGFTGLEDVFAGERNFLSTYEVEGNPRALLHELGKRYEIMNTNVKKWSVGSPAQAPLDSLLALIKAHGLKAGDLKKMVIRVDERGAKITDNNAMPDINMQNLLAVMLIDGGLTFADCHDASRMKRPVVRRIKSLIELIPSPELNNVKPPRQGIVEFTTRDGRHLKHRTYAVRGTGDNPMTRAEIEDKSADLLAPVLGARRTRALIDTVWKLERVADMRSLRPLLSA